ncbi:F-box protein: endocytic membrane traffic, recycling ReCYcling 1 [Massospora cicadina]|nr:F-box protein: endocytic membrane traffic, recycling ReCYcling 1 [Massospora cicadina]
MLTTERHRLYYFRELLAITKLAGSPKVVLADGSTNLHASTNPSEKPAPAKPKSYSFNGWLGLKRPNGEAPALVSKLKGAESPKPKGGARARSTTRITDIDIDTMVYLFRFMTVETLLKLKGVSKRFEYFVSLDRVWAHRLKCIQYAAIDWNLGLTELNAAPPQAILQTIWCGLKGHYLQFRQLDLDTHLAAFQCDLQQTSEEALVNISRTLLKLTNLSKAKMVDDWVIIRNHINLMKGYYESALLNDLSSAYAEMDLEELKIQCSALKELGDGNLGVRWLVEQNPIFIHQNYTVPEGVGDAESACSVVEQYFEAFYLQISEGNTTFIEQLFRDCLTGLVYPILNSAEEQCDMVPALYSQILVACLEHGDQLLLKLEQDKLAMDLGRVEGALYLFFRPLLDAYAKHELLFLDLNYTTMTKGFLYSQFGTLDTSGQETQLTFLRSIDSHRRKVMDSMSRAFNANKFSLSRHAQAADDEAGPIDSMLGDAPGHQPSSVPKIDVVTEAPLSSVYSFSKYVSVELGADMVELNRQSLQRVGKFKRFSKFSACDRLVKNTVEQIFARLTTSLGVHHVSKGFEVAFRLLRAHQSSQFQSLGGELVGPVVSFFQMVRVVDRIHGVLETHYRQELKPFIDFNDFLDPCNISKKRFETSIDEMVASGLDLSIQTLMHHVHSLLQHHQTAADFKPGRPLDQLRPTQACQEVVDCLIAHVSNVRRGDLEPHILEEFYKEVALRLFHDLCKHIKAFTFDEAGGYQLLSDLSGYFSWVATLDIPDVIDHFQALKEVANLYLLAPDNLKILLQDQERFLGIFHPEDLLEFVQRRLDYRKIQKLIEVEGCSTLLADVKRRLAKSGLS